MLVGGVSGSTCGTWDADSRCHRRRHPGSRSFYRSRIPGYALPWFPLRLARKPTFLRIHRYRPLYDARALGLPSIFSLVLTALPGNGLFVMAIKTSVMVQKARCFLNSKPQPGDRREHSQLEIWRRRDERVLWRRLSLPAHPANRWSYERSGRSGLRPKARWNAGQ